MDVELYRIKCIAEDIRINRYPQAHVIFLAGSFVRGEGTSTSDLDLVVLFDQVPHAYRKSFFYDGWPIEVFVHDPQTLEYFFREVDRPSGFPCLPAMVAEGVEIPGGSALSDSLKSLAATILEAGPPQWNKEDINSSRYMITDLIEDLKDPRSIAEMHATATRLYSRLSNHYFRSRRLWSAKGKAIPRRLREVDAHLADRFVGSFEQLFSENAIAEVIELAELIVEPDGGFLFEGHKLEAPETWRIS